MLEKCEYRRGLKRTTPDTLVRPKPNPHRVELLKLEQFDPIAILPVGYTCRIHLSDECRTMTDILRHNLTSSMYGSDTEKEAKTCNTTHAGYTCRIHLSDECRPMSDMLRHAPNRENPGGEIHEAHLPRAMTKRGRLTDTFLYMQQNCPR